MKILFLLPIFKNTGPSNVVVSMINQLISDNEQAVNNKLFLVSFNPCQDGYETKFSAAHVKLIQLPGFNLKSLLSLWRLVRNEKIDIVHSHCLLPDIAAPFIACFNKAKTVATVHCNVKDNYRNEYRFPKGPLYYFIHKTALAFIKQKVSVSTSAKLSDNTPIIYNGIQPRTLQLQPSEQLNIVFAGRLIESKNIRLLMASFALLKKQLSKPCQLHIFGDGELMSDLKAQVAQTNDESIMLHGFVSDYLSQVPSNSIVVNPSLFEGMPMAVIEAIACNLPVVLSDITAHQEIAKHISEGVVLHQNTPQSFCDAVMTLIDGQERVRFDNTTMLAQFNQHFSNRVMVDNYLAIYQQLV